ncbi:hypothetical protein O6H91_07G002700 [Diphasiastrum complanatum]|uniref:Uncharacterized protein n=1 Tax=Diphasiastrum complanatum TaxID=34168 RepID=A0ACC2D1N4_DIPCM|nr:hypothetical protein O6H91_07G002700 [Diphasiastrum complanatum]
MMVGFVPNWLSPFLVADYFTHCRNHVLGKNEKNYFCIDCVEGPICHIELLQRHTKHMTLQVRRASHVNAVRINDIHKLIDVSDIQSYVINSAKIVFLLSRPQQKLVKGARHWCTSCGRTIADPVMYCSIGCKLAGLIHSGSFSGAKSYQSGQEDAFSTKKEVSDTESFEPSTPPLRRPVKTELQAPAKRPRLVFAVKLKTDTGDENGLSSFKLPLTVNSKLAPFSYNRSMPGSRASALLSTWPEEIGSFRMRRRKGIPHRSPLI